MNKLLLALVLTLGTSICVTGCNKTGNTDQATKKIEPAKLEPTKTEDKKPQDKPPETAKAKDLIVGRWEGTDSKGKPSAVEFTAFGTVKTVRPDRGSGKYLARDDGDLDMEFASGDRTESQKCKIKVSDAELTVTDLDDRSQEALFVMPGKYKKVKSFSAAVRPISDLILGRWKGRYAVGQTGSAWMVLEFKKGGDLVWHSVFKSNTDKTPDSDVPTTPILCKYKIGLDQPIDPRPILEILSPTARNSYSFTLNETTLTLINEGSGGAGLNGDWKRE